MSPYFPKREETAYQCPGCGGWFVPGNRSCLVAHAPGTCCHEYETPTIPPERRTDTGESRDADR